MKCCPKCGQKIKIHCYHYGSDVSSQEMDVEQAIKITERWLEGLRREVERKEAQLAEFRLLVK